MVDFQSFEKVDSDHFSPVSSLFLWRGRFSEVLTPPFSWTSLPLKEVSYTSFSLTVLLSFQSSLEMINDVIEHLTPPGTSSYSVEKGEVAVNMQGLPKLSHERRNNSAIVKPVSLYPNRPPASPSLGLRPLLHTPNPPFIPVSLSKLIFPKLCRLSQFSASWECANY